MIRHAKANHINMSIEKSDDNLKITMQDNGIGFNPEELKNSKGIGWKNIFSRVSMLDGDIKLESELQKGTIVFINLKLFKSLKILIEFYLMIKLNDNESQAESWNDLQNFLFDVYEADKDRFRSKYAYRGVSDKNYGLETSIQRIGRKPSEVENHLIRNFQKYSPVNTLVDNYNNIWNWISLYPLIAGMLPTS